ncbi:hypothetical protein A2872_00045 [Candidatus Gottesmanbacteria bacterium RIFCSPHIGHO2_01_FULL_42_12]|uniref:TIGR02611 family protein n=1 Tax=Candidatus Gottesmanbacteria bacterium RIFCSPHIGHO2_01_FULL_42_12 TaxID=1798377 RepID=A0A1F5Z5B0_9BACT|nr:MAG: hypothetical protein A2872_00045 [Candidatus Gottesmanbacteria bacterium RIFCSPHIGHO2_01_FULL_42_12]
MKQLWLILRKSTIFIIGIALVILGIIFIPLPGPGLLLIIAGLFILSLEFAWAERHLDRAKKAANKVVEKAKNKPPTKNS